MTALITTQTDERGVATIWLDRADKHNALSPEMLSQLTDAAHQVSADQSIRAVVLAARGPTFCAGGDLAWFKSQGDMDRETRIVESRRIAQALSALAAIPHPLIGRVQGNAFGGGVGLCCICDVVVGVQTAKLGLTEVKLGVIPANIGPYVVARMGEAKARQVFMSARIFDAVEAERLNILSKTVEADALDTAIEAEIAPYLLAAPGAVRDAKALLNALAGQVKDTQIDFAISALADRWETDEAQEGLTAFLEKRKPSWI